MAVTQNTYTGDGTTVLFSFTFPYLETTDIKVSLNGTITTAYTLANATTIQFNTAPANGAAIRIYRVTDDAALAAQFYPGSAIRSQDLNDNFTQNLYVTQESNRDATSAIATANSALTASASATSTSNTALSQSSTALSNSTAAVSTANTASANATTALSQSATAVTTANSSQATATSAAADAASALSASATASSNASTALSQSNTALSNSSTALSQSSTALSNSASAVTTAGTASSNASTALSTANTAISTANAAASAVANAILYDTVANVAAIPGSPANNDAVEVTDSTGIESFTPLSGIPSGYVGDSGLSVRIVYTTTGSTWNWIQYFPNDPETRYGDAIATKLAVAGGTMTGALGVTAGSATAPSVFFTGDTNTGIYSPGADQLAISTNGTGRLFVDSSGRVGVGVAPSSYNADADNLVVAATGETGITIASTSSANSNIFFADGTTGDQAYRGIARYDHSTDSMQLWTAAAERLRLTSDGKLGLGSSSPGSYNAAGDNLVIYENGNSGITIASSATGAGSIFFADGTSGDAQYRGTIQYAHNDDKLYIGAAAGTAITIDSSNRVGIGSTSPDVNLVVEAATGDATIRVHAAENNSGSEPILILESSNDFAESIIEFKDSSGTGGGIRYNHGDNALRFQTNGPAERARIDSSGRLLLGTSTARSDFFNANSVLPVFQIQGTGNYRIASITAVDTGSQSGAGLVLAKSRGVANTVVQSGDYLGELSFQGADGTELVEGANIAAIVDGAPGANDLPTRLVFSTCPDNSASPVERMRIRADGRILAGSGGDGIWHGAVFSRLTGNVNRGIVIVNTGSGIGILPGEADGTTNDNGTILGFSSVRWSVVYAATGTINTSDATEKQDIRDLSSAELAAATELKTMIKAFRWKDSVATKGDDARIHFGVIAQEVQEMFARHGLDATNYGFWCSDTFYELDGKPVFVDEDGNYPDGAVAKTRLGIRYSELLAFVIAAL
jgi:hypothetical protein